MLGVALLIDPMQKWPPLIFVTEKNYLLTEIYYFTVKIMSKGITVWSFKAIFLSDWKLQGHNYIMLKT